MQLPLFGGTGRCGRLVVRRALDAHHSVSILARDASRVEQTDQRLLGDGVMALFIPVITGENHAGRAIKAGRAILDDVERDGLARNGLMVGAGVHTGDASVGVVGGDEKVDFTALGDTVNIAARLGRPCPPG
jgi:adenylate cyclase